jgi:hypothetical protein
MAHEQILDVIAAHYAVAASSTSTHAALTDLLALVHSREEAVTSARLALESQIDPSSVTKVPKSVNGTSVSIAVTSSSNPSSHSVAIARTTTGDSDTHVDARIENANTARMSEVEHIIERNATLLAKFLPATTTASSTQATSTTATSTTINIVLPKITIPL